MSGTLQGTNAEMAKTIEITLNGEAHRIVDGHNLQDLIGALGLTGKALALAVNREVVPRANWEQRVLRPGERVDVVRAIGGG